MRGCKMAVKMAVMMGFQMASWTGLWTDIDLAASKDISKAAYLAAMLEISKGIWMESRRVVR